MAEKEKAGPSLDFKTVLLVAAVVGGAALVHTGLQSSRPDEKQTLERTALGDQVVAARLWQDPFEVTLNYRAKHRERIQSEEAAANESKTNKIGLHGLRELADQLTRHQEKDKSVTVLEVMTSGGSYAEDAEDRQRHRYAVLSALGTAGYIPWDAEHLGYAQTRWPRAKVLEGRSADNIPSLRGTETNEESRLIIPFEWFIPNPLRPDSKATTDVLLLWLNADAFEDHPLKRLAQLNHQLVEHVRTVYSNSTPARYSTAAQIHNLTKFKLLEPRVHPILEEIESLTSASAAAVRSDRTNRISLGEALPNLEFYSSWATTSDAVLGGGGRNALTHLPGCESWRFFKATSTDDELAEELVDELSLRGVDLTDKTQCVALISEWDTFYGRALPLTFAATVWCRQRDQFTADSFTDVSSAVQAISNGAFAADQLMWKGLSSGTRDLLSGRTAPRSNSLESLAVNFNKLLESDLRPLARQFKTNAVLEPLRRATDLSLLPAGKRRHLNRLALEAAFPGRIHTNDFATAVSELKNSPGAWPSNILRCTYLRGIDGKVPSDASEENPNDKSKSKTGADGEALGPSDAQQRPEGHSQMDYMPRLADSLVDREKRFKRENRGELKAIGILGSDVYDKLLVLQSLRGKFTDELFFTTDLDARLFHADSLKFTRNLLVASSFGLRLRRELQKETPPFRDTYQTGQYLACLAALGYSKADADLATLAPRRFELGWKGAYDISLEEAAVHPHIPRPIVWNASVLHDVRVWVCVGLGLVVLTAILSSKVQHLLGILWAAFWGPQPLPFPMKCWLVAIAVLAVTAFSSNPLLQELGFLIKYRAWGRVVSHPSLLVILLPSGIMLALVTPPAGRFQAFLSRRKWEKIPRDRKPPEPFKSFPWWLFRLTILPPVLAVAALGLSILLDDRDRQGEPFSLIAGLSVWPTEIIRLVAAGLSIHFLVQSHSELQKNRQVIRDELGIPELPPGLRLFSQLGFWRSAVVHLFLPGDAGAEWSVKTGLTRNKLDLFHWFARFGDGDSRFPRVAFAAAIYGLLIAGIYSVFDHPFQPARGGLSLAWNTWLEGISGALMVCLVFFAADASRLCRKFIESLSPREPRLVWPEGFGRGLWNTAFLDEYFDFRAIALRSEAVNRLIFYPFFVLFLLIIARNDFFDRWDWPTSTLLFFTLCSAYAVYSVLALRFAAEQARKSLLTQLDQKLLSALAHPDDGLVEQLRLLRDKIEHSEEGAFAPLSQQPVIKALLMCFSGAGALPVLNYLASKM
jgi:hypothetical protein